MEISEFGLSRSQIFWRCLTAVSIACLVNFYAVGMPPIIFILFCIFPCWYAVKQIQREEWGKAGWKAANYKHQPQNVLKPITIKKQSLTKQPELATEINNLRADFEQFKGNLDPKKQAEEIQRELLANPEFLPKVFSQFIGSASIQTVKEFASLGLLRELKLDEKQASLYLGLAKKTLQNYRQEHIGIAYYKHKTRISFDAPLSLEQQEAKKEKTRVCYRLGDLEDYLEECKVEVFNK